ncbi:ATP-dependent protease [Methylocaldum marinum]|uniref:endopeptidase La n=1 Tax=Methylocaldum marinum TaxID=1432792 RepID=A0A250L270_9GAMM|nr:ATP-binding protein [Methylocaldum marinum]BBA36489.1 ATP-dependent protease [Methylocaldum marinum]
MTNFHGKPGLPPAALRARVRPEELPFETTEDLEPFRGMLGQDRAHSAIAFGVAMERPGYNIYVMGEAGTGRLSLVTHYLRARAQERASSGDWAYINNFDDPRKPLALQIPPGRGKTLLADIETLVDNLLATFPAAFENPAYQRRKTDIEREVKQRYDQAIDKVERRAKDRKIALFRNGDSVVFSPLVNGKPADEDDFAALPDSEKAGFHSHVRELEDYLNELLSEMPQWKRESINRQRQLDESTIDEAIEPLLSGLYQKYAELPAVLQYLADLRRSLTRVVAEHLAEDHGHEPHEESTKREILIAHYAPRLLVSHSPDAGAPVVYEANPTHPNLFGRLEYVSEQGTLTTHYRLIYPGAMHLANGGYLVVEAEKMIAEPHVWPTLKRTLKSRHIKIELPAEEQPAVAPTLDPEVIPLSVKLVLVGSRELYYVLQSMDPEFTELFRVLAEFDDNIPLTPASVVDFARLIKTHAEADGYKPLSAAAVARLIEFSAREAEHREHLSARVHDVFELVAEAEHFRGEDETITERHIQKALAAKEERLGRVSRRLLEDMLNDTILINTDGDSTGRINGLTILEIGDGRFGIPARITATIYPGDLGIVDIEREAELGQAIHSKGIMILSGYLGHKYASEFPLAISANIALEQSYGYVDGDSAALAEVCALISALTGIPLAQAFAVTGSINQYGEVQAVGGINEKIEGFFRLCRARGLTGRQGVLIPKANIRNLMLNEDVIEAVRHRAFAVHAVNTVDQTLELLTGRKAEDINRLAVAKLRQMARHADRRS